MEQFIPRTPLAFITLGLLATVVILKIMRDIKSARASRRTHNLVMQFVVQKNTPKVAAVIELTKSAETLFPLLGHLKQHNYSKLEVVVIVKHTAGIKAQAKLNYYKTKNKFKNLKIVKHKKGMDRQFIVKKFIKSQFVMQLQPTDRLSDNFFTQLAFELLDKRNQVFIPRNHVSPKNTIVSALNSIISIWKHVFLSLETFTSPSLESSANKIYRRQELLKNQPLQHVYISKVAVHRRSASSWMELSLTFAKHLKTKLLATVLTALLTLTTLSFIYLTPQEQLLLIQVVITLYTVICVLSVIKLSGYSFFERINLILFAPFSLIYILLFAVNIIIYKFYAQFLTQMKTFKPKLTSK